MTETKFRQEGEPAFPVEEKEPEGAEGEGAAEGEGEAPADKAVPFNEDPKVQEYIDRQVSSKIDGITKTLEEKFGGDVAKIKEEFGKQRQANAEDTKVPKWFGGNQEQWDEYRGWLDGRLEAAEKRAISGTFEQAKASDAASKKATEEATNFFNKELATITADKTLNPSGKAIDPAKLLKAAMDNDLIDSKGRWNYRAAVRFLSPHTAASHAPAKKADKDIAAASMDGAGGAGGEQKPKTFKTPADFAKKRPW